MPRRKATGIPGLSLLEAGSGCPTPAVTTEVSPMTAAGHKATLSRVPLPSRQPSVGICLLGGHSVGNREPRTKGEEVRGCPLKAVGAGRAVAPPHDPGGAEGIGQLRYLAFPRNRGTHSQRVPLCDHHFSDPPLLLLAIPPHCTGSRAHDSPTDPSGPVVAHGRDALGLRLVPWTVPSAPVFYSENNGYRKPR